MEPERIDGHGALGPRGVQRLIEKAKNGDKLAREALMFAIRYQLHRSGIIPIPRLTAIEEAERRRLTGEKP